MNTENKLKPKFNWPDEIRRKMVEKSEFYSDPQVYQFGYYDGFQKAIEGCDVLPSELLKQRDELLEPKIFEIDFEGHVLTKLKFENGKLEVLGAINGYGNAVSPVITEVKP